MMLLINGCAPAPLEPLQANTPQPTSAPQLASTSESSQPSELLLNNEPLTIAEVEGLAGFNVKEPTYLPVGVSVDFATYQTTPSPYATLYFKIVHEQYGDMGRFFLVMQEPQTEAPPDVISYGESVDGCEVLEIGDKPVVYRLHASLTGEGADTEGLDWYADGFAFRLLRVAGEPNKIYKQELIKVVSSMK